MTDYTEIFAALGQRLIGFGNSIETQNVIRQAIDANAWFSERDIRRAVDAIRCEMLDEKRLRLWRASYPTSTPPRRVAIIMAGNIPLVGFFDLLCVVMAGDECYIKTSSKDTVLMRFMIDELKSICATIPIHEYHADDHYDKVIATGGDDANRYFEEHFRSTQRLLRGSRHSVALLTGEESHADIEALCEDITAYSGMGCRSVSMIFAPHSTHFDNIRCSAANPKLERNILSTKALYDMQGESYVDCGGFLLKEGSDFPSSLTTVTLCRYDDIDDAKRWIREHDAHIQCVVTRVANICRSVDFGRAQYPTLCDYADGIDTMRFLLD